MKIVLPNNHHSERKYVVEVLFQEWLGLRFEVQFAEQGHTEIIMGNGGRIQMEDHFFNSINEQGDWLSAKYLPQSIDFQSIRENPFLPESDMPVIFGNTKMVVEGRSVVCGHDALASVFFMLTRWEEAVLPDRDVHQRFPAKASLAHIHGFLHRPLANEIAEMFWNMLQYLGIDQPRKSTKPTLLLTHDVDHPLLWPSARFFVKKLAGDLLKRRDAQEALFSVSSYSKTAFFGKQDPYDNFDHLMNVAEKANLPAYFFFMAGTGTAFDPPVYLQWPFVNRLFESIRKRGHRIGFHPSYRTYNDADLFSKEKQALEEACGQAVTVGRQHFLRFQAPVTWRIWADNGMEWDSTLAYAEQPGFRCGSCLPFPVFDIERREVLPLWERPLIVMEGSYRSYMNLTPPQMEANMMALWKTTSKYGGEFTFLWHNSAFETPYYLPYQDLYHRFVEMASQSTRR